MENKPPDPCGEPTVAQLTAAFGGIDRPAELHRHVQDGDQQSSAAERPRNLCGEYEAGQNYGSIILGFDRARESTHRHLMQLYYLAGDRTGALRQYERCARALDAELGVRERAHGAPTVLVAGSAVKGVGGVPADAARKLRPSLSFGKAR